MLRTIFAALMGVMIVSSASAATITIEQFDDGVEYIHLYNEIVPGDANRLQEVIDDNPDVKLLRLTSGGGSVNEARELSAIIRGNKFDTFVDDLCGSACTQLFVSGTNRYLKSTGQLGFHRARFNNTMVSPDVTADRLLNYGYGRALEGIKEFVDLLPSSDRAAATYLLLQYYIDYPKEPLGFPTVSELVDTGIVTHTY